jgi:hypothetical protein
MTSKKDCIALMDAVKENLPIAIYNVMMPDKGRCAIYKAVEHEDILSFFDSKFFSIEPYTACMTFTKNELAGHLAVMDKKIQTKTYVSLYERKTILPTAMIFEINIIKSDDVWYDNLKRMLKEFSDSKVAI